MSRVLPASGGFAAGSGGFEVVDDGGAEEGVDGHVLASGALFERAPDRGGETDGAHGGGTDFFSAGRPSLADLEGDRQATARGREVDLGHLGERGCRGAIVNDLDPFLLDAHGEPVGPRLVAREVDLGELAEGALGGRGAALRTCLLHNASVRYGWSFAR